MGTTTLLNVKNAFSAKSTYAPEGGSIQPGDQFMITEDSIQVIDLRIVSSIHATLCGTGEAEAVTGQFG